MIGFAHYYKSDNLIESGSYSFRRFSAKPISSDVDERFIQFVTGTLDSILPEDFGDITEIPMNTLVCNVGDATWIDRTSFTVELPDTVTVVGENAFNSVYIREVIFSKNIKTIGQNVMLNSDDNGIADFSKAVNIPTRLKSENDADYNSFGTSVTVIKVPSSLYSTWKNRADWSNVASKLVSI